MTWGNAKLGRMTTVIMRTCEGDMRMMLLLLGCDIRKQITEDC